MREPRNRVVQVRRFGGPDELEVVDAPLPTAGRGEVRVRVLASGVEYTDVVIRRHLYPQTMRRRSPFVGRTPARECGGFRTHARDRALGARSEWEFTWRALVAPFAVKAPGPAPSPIIIV
jgi:hypothetical protein